jgi:DNA-binding CsgD family transcriptional regulator/tetratricopeptide (TPR) repeat protein
VARALDAVAVAAERRGALATAAHGFDRAASLSADGDARARRLLASAEAWLGAGHWRMAIDQLEQAAIHAGDPNLRAEVAASTGQLEAYRSGPEKGAAILVEAAESLEGDDPALATRLYTYAVNVAVFAADAYRAVELAGRAEAAAERAGGLSTASSAMARVQAGLLAGDPSVVPLLGPIAELAVGLVDSDLGNAEHVFSLVVFAHLVLESWDEAEALLDVFERRAADTGRLFIQAVALAMRGEIDFRRGRWTEAYASVTTDVWDTLDLPGAGGSLLQAVQARLEAGLGLDDEARAHASAALAAGTETGTHAVAAWASASLGFLELGRGRPQAALGHLERVAATLERGGFGEPGIVWSAPDLVEALWRTGDVGAARRRLEAFQAQADATGRRWALATAARGAGLLAPTDTAMEEAFAAALGWHDRLDAPFERARTLLGLGERRQAFGHDEAAWSLPVREALAAFERIGAQPWAAQARRLLGDARPVPEPGLLTRQERQVAALVGRGATNREAAEQLFLSPRTIDFHLRNIYRKLHIRSRTELAVHLATHGPPAADDPEAPHPSGG